ncbi:glycosyltransferase family 2 protein [Desulfosediminicola sp.]|uniref:glycosyltransferase family 2 protein n=1 Tax=Desulfosediminicola sp. TaxID=2886825 RepID=UPI003AF268C1
MQRVSIIVPAFNAAKYLGDCLDSLVRQTFQAIEIIVIDDGSTDNTASIVKGYADTDDRVRLIDLARNYGIWEARRRGVELSSCEYVCFVDSDDCVSVGMIDAMLKRIIANESDIAVCGHRVIDGNNTLQKGIKKFGDQVDSSGTLKKFAERGYGSGVLWGKIYRKGTLAKYKKMKFEERLDFGEDYLVNFGAFLEAKSVSLMSDVLYYHRKHPDSITAKKDPHISFCRQLNAFARGLQLYSPYGEDVLCCIEESFVRQFRFKAYNVKDRSKLANNREEISRSLTIIARYRPESIYGLIHCFDDPSSARRFSLSRYIKNIFV